MRKLLRRLAISLGVLVGLFVLAEIAARLGEPGPFSLVDREPYLRHPALDHVHRAGFEGRWDGTWYEINSRGWRGSEVEPTFAPEELRMVALGDSCTFGKGVVEEDTWPRQLERLLQAKVGAGRKVLVANLGINGYSTRQYLAALREQGVALRPHVVVLGYNLNDFPNLVQQTDKQVFHKQNNLRAMLPAGLRDDLGRLALFRFLRQSYYAWNTERDWARMERQARAAEDEAGESPAAREEAQRIRELADRVALGGGHFAMFLFPYESMVYLESFTAGPAASVRAMAEELGVGFFDAPQRFREKARESKPPRALFLRGDRYHPNREGYRVVAEGVLSLLEERGWLLPAR